MRTNLVLCNGDIHTMDTATPRVRAIAIAGDRILAVGSDDDMRALLAPGGKVIDLHGHTVVPGFTDSHIHFLFYALSLKQVDLTGAPTLEEALALVAKRAKTMPPGRWIVGRGWDHSLWAGGRFPSRHDLDRVAPEHPVWLKRKCGHVGWANSLALEMAGITARTLDPPGGRIERDPATGEPTGLLFEDAAMGLIDRMLGKPSVDEAADVIKEAMGEAHRLGLVGIHVMEEEVSFRAFQKLRADGELKLRVLMQIPEESLDAAVRLGLQSGFGDEWLRFGGVKLFSDGALGSHTAAMLEPYGDRPDDYGIVVLEPERLRHLADEASEAGIALFVHAIGDRANRNVLDAIESTRSAGKGLRLRHRIEHAQLLHPDDIPRLARLGVVASMQPIHATQDMLLAERLWGERCAGAYAWRSLLDAGTVLAFGSDAPVEDPDVLKGIHAAVTRRRADGSPGPQGWHPEQRISVEEAVRAYTVGAAYASGEETIKGTLSPGKLADLVVLSRDIFTIDPIEILNTKVLATMIGGEFVHSM